MFQFDLTTVKSQKKGKVKNTKMKKLILNHIQVCS